MCNCIAKAEERLRELYPTAEEVSIVNVELCSGKLYSTFEVKFPNKKKPEEKLLLHSYCPICGEKY